MTSALNLPLARHAIDRDYLSRSNENLFAELWANPATRILPMFQGKVLLESHGGADVAQLKLLAVGDVSSIDIRVYLGRTLDSESREPASTPVVLAVVNETEARRIEGNESAWHSLRRTGAGLSARDAGLYAQGLAIANWHESHPFCPRCGAETQIIDAGWVRRCEADDKEVYPRTDPAIIAAVIDDEDRILLGSQGIWEDNRWSILAGFVEPGESLTAAVQREMFEEAGIRVEDVEYQGSQAWPFPYSLMVGFMARAHGNQNLNPDGLEIEKLRWFSREELANSAGEMLLPGKLSIARALIEHWYGGELVSASEAKGRS